MVIKQGQMSLQSVLAGTWVATTVVAGLGGSLSVVYAQGAIVKIDGSSTVYPISERVAEGFQKTNGAKVTVGISGTGGGFKKFCAGETDIANASRPIKEKEMEACKAKGINYIELPVAYDALTVVINKNNTWATNLTPADLKKIWEPGSTIKNWNQVRADFPNQPLKLYGPGADSGTFDYFTEAINGKSRASRKDYTASEDDNVLVQGVSRDKGGLGYFGYAYYEANKNRIKSVAINGVAPSKVTVESGQYTPLSRPIFIYINAEAAKKPEVKSFVEYYLKNAPSLVSAVGYVPFTAAQYSELQQKRFASGKTGTVFGGKEEVGLKISDMISRELKN